jgi:hypothetical protein
MAIINSTVSFSVLFGTPDGLAADAIVVPGSEPRPDGLPGCAFHIVQGQQTIPQQVFTDLYFQTYVAGGQVTVIDPN